MKHHEKFQTIPKHLRSMKNRIKQSLALVGILIMSLSLSGCEKLVEADVSAETKLQTTTAVVKNKEENTSVDYPAYPLPDGWTFEKICALVEIDGTSLIFPCTVEELENLNDKITVGEPDEVFNYCEFFYDDVSMGTIAINRETQLGEFIVFKTDNYINENADKITFAGYTINQVNEINSFMEKNFIISSEYHDSYYGNSLKEWRINNDNINFVIRLQFEKSYLDGIFIKWKEIENE